MLDGSEFEERRDVEEECQSSENCDGEIDTLLILVVSAERTKYKPYSIQAHCYHHVDADENQEEV